MSRRPFASFMYERRPRAPTTTTPIRSTATSVDFVGRYESLEDDLKLALGRVVANLAITTAVSAQTTTALQTLRRTSPYSATSPVVPAA